MALCIRPNSTFPPEIGGIVGARPALARLNRFEGTTQVYCLRKDFLELTGKTSSGPGKGADAETVTGGLILTEVDTPGNL